MDRDDSSQERERVLANKRRQAYFRNRRIVQRMKQGRPGMAYDHMTVEALRQQMEQSLVLLLNQLGDGTSPQLYGLARDVWECYAAAIQKGFQLELLPPPPPRL